MGKFLLTPAHVLACAASTWMVLNRSTKIWARGLTGKIMSLKTHLGNSKMLRLNWSTRSRDCRRTGPNTKRIILLNLFPLKGKRLRTHGSLHEAKVPFILSEPLKESYQKRADERTLRSREIFEYALNGIEN